MTERADRAAMSFEDVSVEFGATKALDGLTLSLRGGEIVGLLGHNGAGKSTLVNVATGALGPTRGRIFVGDDEVTGRPTPAQLARRGISVIHQEPALSPNLTIEENLFLGQEQRRSAAKRQEVALAALQRVGLSVSLKQPLWTLSFGHRQLVNLARATIQGEVRALFLDEPTAALGGDDTEKLHEIIRGFARSGSAIAYVSHRLSDVFEICDRIVVLREGRLVLDRPTVELTMAEVTAALAPGIQRSELAHGTPGEVMLEFPERGAEFRAGEVVGLFGMAGGDQFRLLENAFGVRRGERCLVQGRRRQYRSPRHAMADGIHLVPADRERDGILANASGVTNLLLPWLGRLAPGLLPIRKKEAQAQYDRARAGLGILGPDGHAPLQAFSGGNRQKHVVARWVYPVQPKILLMAQPSQGVDIGAKQDIIREIRSLAAQGACVVVASAEADEIVSMCDRAYAVDRGRCVAVPRTEKFEEDLVGKLIEIVEVERQVA